MIISMIKKIIFFLLCFILIAGCSSIYNTSTLKSDPISYYPDKISDLEIEGSTKAIIAVNTDTTIAASASLGVSPLKTSTSLQKLTQSNTTLKSNYEFKEPFLNQIPIYTSLKAPTNADMTHKPSKLTDPEITTFYDAYEENNVQAIQVTSNNSCIIYVEKTWYDSQNLDSNTHFNTNISHILSYFHDTVIPQTENALGSSISTLTDVDRNGKVILFFMDFNEASLAGYVWAINLFKKTIPLAEKSNEKEIIFINNNKIDITKTDTESFKHVIAHEYAHLVGQSYRLQTKNYNFEFDSWIEEGIAEGLTPILSDDSDILKASFEGLNYVKEGTGFLKSGSIDAIIYKLSYTFLEYCRIQMNKTADFYQELISHSAQSGDSTNGISGISNHIVIDTIILENNPSNNETKLRNFEDAVISYKIANFVKHPSNKYGYKNHELSNSIPSLLGPSTTSPSLESSGAVYYISGNQYSETTIDNFIPGNSGETIKFLRISPP